MAAVELCLQYNLSSPVEPWPSHTMGSKRLHETAGFSTLQWLQTSISAPAYPPGKGQHDRNITGHDGLFVPATSDGTIFSKFSADELGRTTTATNGGLRLDLDSRPGSTSVRSSSERDSSRLDKTPAATQGKSRGINPGTGPKDWSSPGRRDSVTLDISKRQRAPHDVDGPNTNHLPCKKRRLRHRLITSRLSQPYSLPATHILNRETGEDTPVLSRFLKFAAMGPKKAGHQTAMVRKAAILNRVRLNVRQAAVTRGHDRMWRMSDMSIMGHGLQLVTASTGAMFPGRGSAAGMSLPHVWRPHTTGTPVAGTAVAKDRHGGSSHISHQPGMNDSSRVVIADDTATHPISAYPSQRHQQNQSYPNTITITSDTPVTSIMTPLHHEEAEESTAFLVIDDDYRYADLSDDDMDDVYTDFGALFGGGAAKSYGDGTRDDEEEHFYEEYLDELDGIPWA
ncbi:hypothetical protein PG993_010103 [Apiospora rasikravindrae]|uniref:Uncharacterized protein n=1 Tax=Apiospora rasikravindrae TaxID=990691 RepID=A0ABR1SLB7_9PEZI